VLLYLTAVRDSVIRRRGGRISLCRPLTRPTSVRIYGEALVAAKRLVAKVINP
jgi:hypothetical protein